MKKAVIFTSIALILILGVSCNNRTRVPGVKEVYKVGETGPAGGIIFYVSDTENKIRYDYEEFSWKYLEMAPTVILNEDTQMAEHLKWGEIGIDCETEEKTGKGWENTRKLINKGKGGTNSFPAAEACDAYSHGGYSDWFLPSFEELKLIYENIYCGESIPEEIKKTIISGSYMSSSEKGKSTEDLTMALAFDFYTTQHKQEISRTETGLVRPVRCF